MDDTIQLADEISIPEAYTITCLEQFLRDTDDSTLDYQAVIGEWEDL